MRQLVVVSACILATACGFTGDVPANANIVCASDHDCPPSLLCAPLIERCVTTIDTEPPSLASLAASSSTTVVASMSEVVTGISLSDVAIAPPLAVLAVSLAADGQTINVVTDTQTPQATYTLTLANVIDTGGNVISPAGASGTFTGYGFLPETDAPLPLFPTPGGIAYGPMVQLAWLGRVGASTYMVDVATDSAFAHPIAGSPFTVSSTAITVGPLTDETYYWRVVSDITVASSIPSVNPFDVLINTLYVYCASGDDCTNDTNATGSRSHPYKQIADALGTAAAFSIASHVVTPTIEVATRNGGVAYVEGLFVSDQSLSLLGGFSADFSTRDVVGNKTSVSNDATAITAERVVTTTTIDGFALMGTGTSGAAMTVTNSSVALTVSNCAMTVAASSTSPVLTVTGGLAQGALITDSSMHAPARPASATEDVVVRLQQTAATLRTCVITSTSSASEVQALQVLGPLAGEVTLDTVTVAAGTSTSGNVTAAALQLSSGANTGSVHVMDSIFTTGTAAMLAFGVHITGLDVVTIERSRIAGGSGTTSRGLAVDNPDTGSNAFSVAVVNSIIAANGPSTSFGVDLEAGTVTLAHSAIAAGSSGSACALRQGSARSIVIDNILFNWSGVGDCVEEVSIHPVTFANNLLLSCGGYDSSSGKEGGTVSDADAINAFDGTLVGSGTCPGSDLVCEHARFSGNLVSTDDIATMLTDADGPDNDLTTIADNTPIPTPASGLADAGKPTSDTDCGTVETPASCGNVTNDITGAARTVPVTIGAYEVDP